MSDTMDPKDIAAILAQRDERWRSVQAGLTVEDGLETEMMRTVLGVLAKDAQDAGDALVSAKPDDIGMIARLQAIIRVAREIRLVLQTVIDNGRTAQVSLSDDAEAQQQEMSSV